MGGKEMEIAIKIAGKVESSFKNALGQATKGLGSITKTVAAATAAAASAVGAIGIAAINTGREFEGAMSQVAATMLLDRTTAEGQKAFETLENAARECGANTAFSATEAAEALNYLALAGYDADKAATALPTVLKLAGAGAMELAAASDMVTDSMSALGIEATEANLTQFSDKLAQTASKSNTSVAQLGEAILTVGGTAKGLAGGTTELNTALGILADSGLKGAEGGTHLRNMILSLQNPRNEAAAEMFKQLGVEAYTSEGKMRGLNEIFGDISNSMEGMTDQQKDDVLSTIFKQTDLAAANAMLSNCTDRFDELSEAIENSAGACDDMYAIQLDNLNGDIDILKSGLSDLGISIYKDLNGSLRGAAKLATDMVGELSEAYKSGGMEGMIGAVGGCLSEVVNVIAEYAPQVVSMGISLLQSFISGIAQNAGGLAAAVAEVGKVFIEGLFTLVPQVILAGIDIIVELAQSITQQLPQLITSGTKAITNFVNGIIQRLPSVITTALTLVQTLVNSLGQNAPMLINAAIQLIGNLIMGIIQMLPQLLQMGIQLILSLAQGIVANLPFILQMGVQLITSLVSGIVQMLPMLIQGGIQLIISLVQGIIANLGDIVQAAVQIVITLATGLLQAIPQLIAAVPELIGALAEAILTTDWIQVGLDIIKGIIDGILASGESLWSALKSLFFGGEVEMPDTSNQGAEVADTYASGIVNNTGAVAAAANDMAATAFNGLDSTGAMAAGTQVGAGFSEGFTGAVATGGFGQNAFNNNMVIMGSAGATALNNGFSTGLSSSTVDTSGFLSTPAFGAGMQAAGSAGASTFVEGFNTGIAGNTITTGALSVDASGVSAALAATGTDGASALGAGIEENSEAVTQAATAMGDGINKALDVGWSKANSNAQAAMKRLSETVTGAARFAAAAIKSAFESMTITIPKPKIPEIKVSKSDVPYGEGGKVNVPKFSVSWNALGGIFDSPTIFNTPAGMQGVGEAGPEAILPLDTLWAKMKEILNEAIAASSGASLIDTFLEKLKGIGSGGSGGQPELAGAGGPAIQYSPVYNLYGSAGKDEIAEADRMSQAEFNRLMKQYEREKRRRSL